MATLFLLPIIPTYAAPEPMQGLRASASLVWPRVTMTMYVSGSVFNFRHGQSYILYDEVISIGNISHTGILAAGRRLW